MSDSGLRMECGSETPCLSCNCIPPRAANGPTPSRLPQKVPTEMGTPLLVLCGELDPQDSL